jgi:hypothetical protein
MLDKGIINVYCEKHMKRIRHGVEKRSAVMLKQTVCTLTTVLYSINVLSNVHMQTLGLQVHRSLYHQPSFRASYSKWYRDNIANPQLLQILPSSEQIRHMVLRNSNP